MLNGDGEYNLDNLKHIRGADSFLGLDLDVRDCQNNEPFFNCTTKHYMEKYLEECGCLPINMRMKTTEEVSTYKIKEERTNILFKLRNLSATPPMNFFVLAA